MLCAWGDGLIEEGRAHEALDLYLQALALDAGDMVFECFNRLARALAQTGRSDEAPVVLSKARDKLETSAAYLLPEALQNWGSTLVSLELFEDAAETFREGLKVSPNDPVLCFGLGQALAGQGQFEGAINQCRKAYKIWQKQATKDRKIPLYSWASALQELERFDEAIEISKRATAADPNDFWQFFGQANVFDSAGL